MFKVVRMKDVSGKEHMLFAGCTETGYAARDILTMPGAYDECVSSDGGTQMQLLKLNGTVGSYRTECYGVVVLDDQVQVQDLTGDVARVLTMPATAANTMMQSMSVELREAVKQAVGSLHYYESVNETSKVCLPDEAMTGVEGTVAQSMRSAKQSYVLRSTENQEIFQRSYDADFGVRLPSLEDIHNESGFKFSSLDILRATMPYRRPGSPSIYEPLYHTPYYKVGNQMGMVPQYLQWLDGYSSNDLLDIQPNERHMQRNLYTLYQSDVSRYVAEMVTGVFFNTEFGSMLTKLWRLRDKDAIDRMMSDIRSCSGAAGAPGVRCSITTTDIEELWANDWNPPDVWRKMKSCLSFDEGYLESMVQSVHPARRIVTTRNLIFVLELSDAQEQFFVNVFIERGFMTHELHEFFLKLCQCAYEANWGHTGSVSGIPPLVDQNGIDNIAKEFTVYLAAREAGKVPAAQECMSLYKGTYGDPTTVDDDDAVNVFSVSDSNDDSDDSISVAFNRYVTRTTAARMLSGELDFNTLYSIRENETDEERKARLAATQDSDSRKVERWLTVDGNRNLVYFLTGAYMHTADVKVYIQAFLKLLRWGERRPKVLALQDHPEIRTVFDLCVGSECENVAIVDEAELVKVNGCDYSLVGFLSSTTNNDINPQHIVGFLLEKNYGSVVKQYLASWEDLVELSHPDHINIGEFKTGAVLNVDPATYVTIESFEKKSYEIYESESCITEGMSLKVRGRELSKIVLLTKPQITSERSYIRSAMNNTIITLQDRQYDNLRRYIENLRRFYKEHGDGIRGIRNAIDLMSYASLFEQFVKEGSQSKQEHNESVAASAISKLSLDFSGKSGAEIQYSTAELKGKFVLVVDRDNSAIRDDTWEPIQFTNPQLQKIASRPNTSIVLLMLKTHNCWLLCRKDIRPDEVDVVRKTDGPKINSEHYLRIQQQITQLLQGGSATYEGMPLKLHISAKLDK